MAATDLPSGLSPACSDVAFLPGEVFTRPSLKRFASIPAATQIIYHHSYLKPDGTVVQLQFDSAGQIFADGVKIAQTAAGNRFFAVNAFGRAYVAVSDGLHGQDVPLQIDQHLNVDRVSQGGPAAAPFLANYTIPAQNLSATLTRSGGMVTAQTSASHQLLPGYRVAISGVADASIAISSLVVNNEAFPGLVTASIRATST